MKFQNDYEFSTEKLVNKGDENVLDQRNNVAGGGCFFSAQTELFFVFVCKLIAEKHISSFALSECPLIITLFS